MIRIMLVDRVRLVCDVIGSALEAEPDIRVVGMETTPQGALATLENVECDIVLVSTSLQNEGALDLVRALTDKKPSAKVLVLGVPDAEPVIMSYINAGAAGYVLRQEPVQDLLANIRAAYDDKALVTPEMAARLIQRIAELSEKLAGVGIDIADYQELTPREREILDLIGEGLGNQEIADRLIIEVGTVKNHVHSILDKLNVNSRKDAAVYLSLLQHAQKRDGR
jgi:two-component system, NarL family, nitrate/nitrite response regulator NarL